MYAMLPDPIPEKEGLGHETNSRCPSQDMKHSFVCASSCVKHYVQPFIWLPWDTRSRPFVFVLREKKI